MKTSKKEEIVTKKIVVHDEWTCDECGEECQPEEGLKADLCEACTSKRCAGFAAELAELCARHRVRLRGMTRYDDTLGIEMVAATSDVPKLKVGSVFEGSAHLEGVEQARSEW